MTIYLVPTKKKEENKQTMFRKRVFISGYGSPRFIDQKDKRQDIFMIDNKIIVK